MKQKGFTLIELLAVIVILAIIALIATPIVLNIIKDSKESANLQSAQFYIDAAEMAITKQIMDDPTFEPTSCDIQPDGNIKCGETLVKVEVSGEKPSSGTITLENGKIKEVSLVLSEKTITKNTEGKLIYKDESSNIVFEGEVTFTLEYEGDLDAFYSLDVSLDQTKFKNYSNYKITIDNDKVYEVICTKNNGDNEYSEIFILGNKGSFSYVYDASDVQTTIELVQIMDNSINLDGEHHVKIEYIDDNVYPHVLRVGDDVIEIFSTELIEGDAILEVKDSDGNIVNLNVSVESDSGYRWIRASEVDYRSDNNVFESFSKNYQSLQQGKTITVTIKQGNNTYDLGGTNFEPNLVYDCMGSAYYYWGNNKLGYLYGC